MLLIMHNACLTKGVFSSRKKIAKLMLISKGKGYDNSPSLYCSLYMLDTAGKFFEKLIKIRQNAAVERTGNLSERQYWIRSANSTVEEVVEGVRVAESFGDA